MASPSEILTAATARFSADAGLSARESQILELAAQGFVDKQISDELGLAYTTVKSYWSRIYSKASVSNRQLVIARLITSLATTSDRQSLAEIGSNTKGPLVQSARKCRRPNVIRIGGTQAKALAAEVAPSSAIQVVIQLGVLTLVSNAYAATLCAQTGGVQWMQ
ncbi:MAG: response regulator transcription factor [Polyangia bacterium]